MTKRVLAAVVGCVLAAGIASAQDRPSPAEVLVKEAKKLRDAKDFDGAKEYLDAARKIEPKNVHVLVNLAWVYNELQDYENGAKIAQDALKVEPNNSDALSELGYAQLKQKQYLRAVTSLRKAVEKDDKNITAYGYLVEALRAVGENDEADEIDAIRKKKAGAGKAKD